MLCEGEIFISFSVQITDGLYFLNILLIQGCKTVGNDRQIKDQAGVAPSPNFRKMFIDLLPAQQAMRPEY